jgi:hypothetical protein
VPTIPPPVFPPQLPLGDDDNPVKAAVRALEHAAITVGKVAIDRHAAHVIVGRVLTAYITALAVWDQRGGAR